MGFSGNVLKFDNNNNVEDFTFILSKKNYTHIGKLSNIKRDTVRCKENLNGANEISFEVYKTLDGEIEECWDKIVDFKSVYVKELNEYFEIKVTYNDNINEVKTITGTSLCEAELSQINIYGTEINTQTDSDRDDYVFTTFYNPENPKGSLLNRVLSFAKHYTIKYVDPSLCNITKVPSFSIDGTSIYDFLIGECAEQFNCMFVFNSVDRSISVYDLYSTCLGCGHRSAFSDICPECGSTDITYFGEDTTIFVNKENLTNEVQFETDTDSVKNCFKLTSGDVEMDMAIIAQNPNGTAYLYTVPIEQREDMSEEFLQKFDTYNALYDSYIDEYQQLSEQAYNLTDEINKYKYYMMPEPADDDEENETAISIASQEAAKLTSGNLSPIGLATLSSSTSVGSIDSAIKNYARVFVNTGYVKVEVVEGSTFDYQGINGDGWNHGQWRGSLRVTCFSNKEDVVVTEPLVINVHDNYGDYCQQTAMKEVALVDEEGSIFNVLKIEDINEFKAALELYSLNRLESFRDAIKTATTTLMSLKQGSENAEWHEAIYVPYYNKSVACELEIEKRRVTIAELNAQLEEVQSRQSEIQKQLNFQDYLGEELYNEFCMYKREQEYNNSNFISDGLDNAQLMDYARQFIDTAQKELYKSSNRQHRISTTLHNLLVMPEFKDIVYKFALGNFIRVQVGNDIYRLRLISYEINFSDLTTLSVEFSDMTKTSNGLNDVQSILQSASSMAKNYDSISKQAEKGNVANTSINEMIESGLNSTTIKIINNVNEDVITDNNGILLRSWNDIEGAYKPNQLRLTHNVIAFTKNNWRSSELGIGEINYTLDGKDYEDYGIITKHLISGKIVAGDIYSADYSSTNGTGSHFDLENDKFSFGDKSLEFDKDNGLRIKGAITGGSININNRFKVDEQGNVTLPNNATISWNNVTEQPTIPDKTSDLTNDSGYETATSIKNTVITKDYIETLKVKAGSVDAENISGTTITGKTIKGGELLIGDKDGTYAEITSDGKLTATNGTFTGTIHAGKGGTIGGWTINEGDITSKDNKLKLDSTGAITGTNWSISKDGAASFSNISINNSGSSGNNNTLIWGDNFSISNTGSITASEGIIHGNLYVMNTQVSSTYLKQGKVIARGSDNPNGKTIGSYETVLRGLESSQNAWGAFFVRRITDNMSDSTYETDAAYKYPFTITGKGDLTIGEGSQFKVTGSNGNLNIGNGNFQVIGSNGNVTIGGTCTINGTTTIDGSCTASNIKATGGQIGGWYIGNPDTGLGALTGSSTSGKPYMTLYPNGSTSYTSSHISYTFYLVVFENGQPKGGLTSSGWKSID